MPCLYQFNVPSYSSGLFFVLFSLFASWVGLHQKYYLFSLFCFLFFLRYDCRGKCGIVFGKFWVRFCYVDLVFCLNFGFEWFGFMFSTRSVWNKNKGVHDLKNVFLIKKKNWIVSNHEFLLFWNLFT